MDDNNQPIKVSQEATINKQQYTVKYSNANSQSEDTSVNAAICGDTVTVTNQNHIKELPSTGSCGVLIYRLAGAILILFAVVLMLMKYKETKTRN